jgi:succinate dehydrogenase cytochrome b subunit
VFRSSVGRKALMAVTGIILVGYVVIHMLGNLQVFLGPKALDNYAHSLKSMPALLWTARTILLIAFVAHISLGIKLYTENQAARPVAYVRYEHEQANIASRTMLLSGLVILAFVIYHLLHFTLGVVQPQFFASPQPDDPAYRPHVYAMVVNSFNNPAVSAAYIVAQIFLGLHLYHAVPSLFQSLGLNHPKYNRVINALGPVVSVVVMVGNISIPLYCLYRGPVTV